MAIDKSERLLNLTMALLSSRRFLTKNEIFNFVAGYELDKNTPTAIESRDRMFERDKDDLRASGIQLEVGSHDPLFDDDIGYRISPESYYLPEMELTPLQYSLINLAMALWKGSQWESAANSVGIKLNAPEIESTITPDFDPFTQELREMLPILVKAISESRVLTFDYPSQEISRRRVEPLKIFVAYGEWYLLAFDLDRNEIRRFKVKRIVGDLFLDKPGSGKRSQDIKLLEVETSFSYEEQVEIHAKLSPSIMDHFSLPVSHSYVPEEDKHILIFNSLEEALRSIFLLGSEIQVLSPSFIIDEIKRRVGVQLNG